MKIIRLLCLGLCLAGCESEEVARERWIASCAEAEFTLKQCAVLYSLKKSSDDAAFAANVGVGVSAGAAGIAASKR